MDDNKPQDQVEVQARPKAEVELEQLRESMTVLAADWVSSLDTIAKELRHMQHHMQCFLRELRERE